MSVKISELPVLAPEDVAAGDVVPIVDQSEGVTKRVDLAGFVIDLAPDPVPDPQDDTDTNAYTWSVGDVQAAAIIESDSNANGTFVKYSDGTMICRHLIADTGPNPRVWTYPAAFISTPDIQVTIQIDLARVGTFSGASPTSADIYRWVASSGGFSGTFASVEAKGYWK